MAQSGPQVIINEIQYHPASDDHGEEYVELYNAGPATVDLSGWEFSDGIHYTFPGGVSVPAGGYVVVGHDPATVEAVYSISGVLGPFESGRLSNSGERVALEDSLGSLVDEVTYDDHLPWPEAADGDGPSLELISPAFDNDRPCSWAASQPIETSLGTPGAQNSVYSPDNIPPCITDVAHTPVFPTSSQSVTVTALVDDAGGYAGSAVVTATLHYRPEGISNYVTLPMTDAGSGLYAAIVPAQDDGLYVEFYVTATDDEDAERSVPEGAPGATSGETGLPVTISYLYQVEDTAPTSELPIYRLIMTQENQTELIARDPFSNVLLDAAFVSEGEVFYNVGVRYRGESSRTMTPRPYRIKFRDAQEFEDRERLNLVSDELGREALAHDLFQRVGLPAPDTRFVTLYVNESLEGYYLDVENVDNEFLRAHFPGDDDGNLYRGYSEGDEGADLRYRGPDPDSYRLYYVKKNNQGADDYSDVIALTDALSNTLDATFRAEAEAVADSGEWLRWFAVQAVLDNHEAALWIGHGDDYFLYHRPSDDRFVLISWDHDYTFSYADHPIWEPNWLGPEVVRRILNYPDFTRWYYQEIASIAAAEFSVAEMYPRIDALPDVVSAEYKDTLKQYVAARIPALNGQIPPTTLSISTNGGEDFVTTEPEVTLEGICSPLRDVCVNGSAVGVQYPTATTWRYTSTLSPGDNVFAIADGLDNHTITVYLDDFHGGTLTEDTTLFASSSPYVITADIIVPTGITLTIQPGVTLRLQAGRSLRVEGGRLLAEGTPSQPILFTRDGGDPWGAILFDASLADNRLVHATVEHAGDAAGSDYWHAITAYQSKLRVEHCTIRHVEGWKAGIRLEDSEAQVLDNVVHDVSQNGIHAIWGNVVVQGNHVYNAFEGIEIEYMTTPAVVLDNHVHDVTDDCIDLDASEAIIERNELHHCGDTGIAIGYTSTVTLTNNLVYASAESIAVEDGASALLVNNTVSGSQIGVGLHPTHEEEGGFATLVNCIVWGNGTSLTVTANSAITVTYSDIEGGWSGEGNINEDPLFRAPSSGIYRLLEDSPCMDAGTAVGAPDEDIWRVYRPHGEGYDMGAHEFFEYFCLHLPLVLK